MSLPGTPHSATDIADYFLSLQDEEAGDGISNLKLQKLLYYAQGCFVALCGAQKPLFKEKIYAWDLGPVVPEIYRTYKEHGRNALPIKERPILDEDVVAFLNRTYEVFGKFSAWKLSQLSHREDPWLDNYQPGTKDIEIPLSHMHRFFKTKVIKKKTFGKAKAKK